MFATLDRIQEVGARRGAREKGPRSRDQDHSTDEKLVEGRGQRRSTAQRLGAVRTNEHQPRGDVACGRDLMNDQPDLIWVTVGSLALTPDGTSYAPEVISLFMETEFHNHPQGYPFYSTTIEKFIDRLQI